MVLERNLKGGLLVNEKNFIKEIKKLVDTFIANWIYLIDEYEKEVGRDLSNFNDEVNGTYTYNNNPTGSELTD